MESQEKTKNKKGKKACLIITGMIVLALVLFLYIRFYFVFGEGVKAGQLNYVVYKGYVFKTYEGKLIQSGLRSGNVNGSIRSNEFIFSVSDKAVAEKLMLAGGREVDLHYREYKGALPWRGYSKYVVDSIIHIK
ncbi:MAG: hypothetical protein LBH19_10990 [Dysgonamonadaceae bacterium]|jgi:hypothetical protein|nr:hypothetical protein [Dysgonamonadaceae bacterium]